MKALHQSKKFSAIVWALLALTPSVWAQDTLKLCGDPIHPMFPDAYQLCPHGYDDDDFRIVYNGQNHFGYFNLGESGLIEVYCDDGNFFTIDSTIDTTVFLQTVGIPHICIITSDSNNHPVIYLDSSTLLGNDTLRLLRQVTTSTWQTIASLAPNDPLVITDTTANTASKSHTYKIAGDCTNGFTHTTIHLQSNGSNLFWTPYAYSTYWLPWDTGAPPPLQGYYIYKRNGNGNFLKIDSTIGHTYTDLNFQNGDEYFVALIKEDGCNSNSWQKTGTPISVESNRLKVGVSGIGKPEQPFVKYFVIGSTLFVELKKANDVWIHDILGKELIHEHIEKLSISLEPGMYILNMGSKGYKVLIH